MSKPLSNFSLLNNDIVRTLQDFEDTLATDFKDAAYLGFEPEKFQTLIWSYWKKHSDDTSKEQFARDIVSFFVMTMNRSKKFNKMKNKISETGKTKLLGLTSKFEIRESGKDSDKNVTFGRLSACFPDFHLQAMIFASLNGYTGSIPNYPVFMQFPSMISIILKSWIMPDSNMIGLHYCWSQSYSKLINPKANEASKNWAKYWSIASDSKLWSEERRRIALMN